ncbi:NfeD family protein [Spirochaeta cellobiosiphila]|uniref:NfeD family protein n=1 Tax=Spirochaeta cellobiosiphila TaxID=504483 RepID=UPI00042544EC|nr:NfeD family protein [Spirochaeta cellobiosiphila]
MNLASILWLLFGIVLVGAEFLIPGLIIIFFAGGAFILGLLLLIFPFLGVTNLIVAQVIAWLGISIGGLFFLRRKFSKVFKGEEIIDDHLQYVGQEVEVTERITPGHRGRIKFQGTTWDALSNGETFEKGSVVQILERVDLHFIVTKSLTE